MATLDDWLTAMRCGDFETAWRIADLSMRERGQTPDWHLPRHEQHLWRGQPLDGKRVLIRCYHGLGDTIQFVRFVPLVERIATRVVLWVQPSLIPLLRTMNLRAELLPLHDGTPECEYDVDVEVMELAHVFRTTIDTIPNVISYLHVEPAQLPPGENVRVGLVWKSGDWDEQRNVPYPLLARLGTVEGVELIALQQDAASHPLARDPLGLARLMRALDLVVTVDSMPAHLAGALGVPVWTLLRKEPDWRWMADRRDSPWYPTMRLYRQLIAGEWEPVVEEVIDALSTMRYSSVTAGQPTTFPSASACG